MGSMESPQTPPAGGKSVEAKRKILSPRKTDFRFAESVLKPHALPEYSEGRTPKEKHPFLFQKKSTPAKSEMQGVFFLSGLLAYSPVRGAFSERTILVRATTRSARAISRDCFQNKFEFCTIDTARKRNQILEPKWGRAEGATLMHSPRRIQNPKGFSTLRVAPRLPIQNKKW